MYLCIFIYSLIHLFLMLTVALLDYTLDGGTREFLDETGLSASPEL